MFIVYWCNKRINKQSYKTLKSAIKASKEYLGPNLKFLPKRWLGHRCDLTGFGDVIEIRHIVVPYDNRSIMFRYSV